MSFPTLSDGTDTVELNFDEGYEGPLAEPKRPEIEIPKRDGNPKQDLGRGNKEISGDIHLTNKTELNGSEVSDPQDAADILKKWHNNATELTWTDEDGNSMTVSLTITSHTKTRIPGVWQRMSLELSEEV